MILFFHLLQHVINKWSPAEMASVLIFMPLPHVKLFLLSTCSCGGTLHISLDALESKELTTHTISALSSVTWGVTRCLSFSYRSYVGILTGDVQIKYQTLANYTLVSITCRLWFWKAAPLCILVQRAMTTELKYSEQRIINVNKLIWLISH